MNESKEGGIRPKKKGKRKGLRCDGTDHRLEKGAEETCCLEFYRVGLLLYFAETGARIGKRKFKGEKAQKRDRRTKHPERSGVITPTNVEGRVRARRSGLL